MNLAIFTVSKASVKKGMIYFSDPFLFFASSLSEHFNNSQFFCQRITNEFSFFPKNKYYRLDSIPEHINIIEGYPMKGLVDFFSKLPISIATDINHYIRAVKKADVILLRLPSPSCIIAFLLAKILRRKIVVYYASDIKAVVFSGNKYQGGKKWIARLAADFMFTLYKLFVEKSDAAIFLSKELMEKHHHKRKYYCFASVVREREIVKRTPVLFEQKVKTGLLYAGRLTHEKGIAYLLKAMSILLQENLDVVLTVCGDGPQRTCLEQMAIDLGINRHVFFVGQISNRQELEKIFEGNHIFVLPSISEGTPKVLIEAMAKGLMIVASNIGGIPNVVTNNGNGILIKEKSEAEIAKAVKTILGNRLLQKKMIENSFQFACNHTMECQAKKVAQIIHSTVCRKENTIL